MSDELKSQLEALEQLVVADETPNEVQKHFEQYFSLPTNPFPPSGIADSSGDNPPLQLEITNRIIRFISQAYLTKNRYFMVIRGDYGTGKTHTLRFIEHAVNSTMNKGDRAARAIYVERPRVEAHELNRTVLQSLGYDTVRKYTWYAIQKLLAGDIENTPNRFADLRKKLTAPQIKSRKRSTASQSNHLWGEDELVRLTPFYEVFNSETILDYRTFLAKLEEVGWSREDVRFYFVNLLLEATGDSRHTDLAQAFIALLLSSDEVSFGTWENLVGITKSKTLSSLRAPMFLQFLLRIMEINGIAYVYLLLDEFEEVPQGYLLSPRQRQDYLYTLREVLNSVQRGLSIIIAISPAGWDATVSLATPLADVNDNLITLERVTPNEVMKLIEHYYSKARRGTRLDNAQTITPFSRDIVNRLLEMLPASIQPTPRNIVQLLHNILENMVHDETSKLDYEMLNDVLNEFASSKSTQTSQPRGKRFSKGGTGTAN